MRLMRTLAVLVTLGILVSGCSKNAQQYYESGNKFFTQQKYKEALVEYRNAVQKDPRFGEARLKLAECYERVGDLRGAFQQYVRAADLLPSNADVQLKAGSYLLAAGRFEDAKAKAEALLQKNRRNAKAQVLLGNAMAGLNDLDGGIAQLEEAIQLDPKESGNYTNLGALQFGKGNKEAAEQAFRQATEIDPRSIPARLALGQFYWSVGRTADAETALRAAHQLDPRDVLANRYLAAFFMASGRPAEAEQPLEVVADITKDLRASLALADYYIGMKRLPEARALLDKLATAKEGFAQAKMRIASLDYAAGQGAAAHKTIEEVLAREPKNDAALLVKARFLAQENKAEEAMKAARAAVAANDRAAGAHYLLGLLLAARGETDQAAKAFNDVLKLNPRAAAAQLQLSRLEILRGSGEGAVQYAEQAVKSAPENALAHLVLARSLMVAGKLPQAESEMKALVQQFPNVSAVQSAMGALQVLKKDTAGARRAYEKALTLDASSVEALGGLVALDLAARRPADARQRVEARLAAAPNDPSVLVLAARTYAATGSLDRAEQALLHAIQADASRLEAYGLLGQLYVSQRKLDAARGKFEELARRQPKPVAAQTMIAMIYEMQGNRAEAQKRYQKVLEIDPRAPVASNNLAWMYVEGNGNLDVALQLAQAAKAGLPDSSEVNDTLGWIYYKKGMPGLALAPLRQAIEKQPGNSSYHYHLGMALSRAGDIAGARQALEQALKVNPNFDGAADARQALAALQ